MSKLTNPPFPVPMVKKLTIPDPNSPDKKLEVLVVDERWLKYFQDQYNLIDALRVKAGL